MFPLFAFQKLRRQEELAKKQQEIQEELERKKQAERDERARLRAAAAEEARRAAAAKTPEPSPPEPEEHHPSDREEESHEPFRSDSPPIPSLKGAQRNQEEVVRELSGMREQLDRQQEEHEKVWGGLVEV